MAGSAGFESVGEVGIPHEKYFGCFFLAYRSLCGGGEPDGLVWMGERSYPLARPHRLFTAALSIMGNSSAISGASAWCCQSHGTFSKAEVDCGFARRCCPVFSGALSGWMVIDVGDWDHGLLVYSMLSP